MTEPREALATSICSTFDMGHHHHEAFLQPDHCDDGLSDADELLRSLRAQGYSVARSEGPGLDAAWARAVAALPERLDERSLSVWWDNRKPAGWWAACTHRFDPLRPIPLIVKGYPTKEAALDGLAAALAAQETPAQARSAPSLDEGLLARALYEVDGFGLLSECRETARDIASVYRRLAQEGATP